VSIDTRVKALVYQVNPVGYITCKWLRHIWRGCLTTRLNGLSLKNLYPPKLPGDDWVRVRTLLGGICGTDVAILDQRQPIDSILQAYSTQPMSLGHENVSVVTEVGSAVSNDWIGKRVCVEPTLSCLVRGIQPMCERCKAGQFGVCENFGDEAHGTAHIPPATSIGYGNRTGGSFTAEFVAHQSQVVPVPDELTDEIAILTDPLACGLHAVLRTDLSKAGRVLVYGAGVIGLALTGCLRAMGFGGQIDVIGRSEYLRQWVQRMGGDAYLRLTGGRRPRSAAIAERTGAKLRIARFSNPMLTGGYDVVYDCVGSSVALTECLKWTRARGQVVIVATGAGRNVDMTPIWFQELTVIGAYGRHAESVDGRDIGEYQLVHELLLAGKLDVDGMLTHVFPLGDYRKAFDVAMHKSAHRAIKVALDFRYAMHEGLGERQN